MFTTFFCPECCEDKPASDVRTVDGEVRCRACAGQAERISAWMAVQSQVTQEIDLTELAATDKHTRVTREIDLTELAPLLGAMNAELTIELEY